jgi:hypothetical protein
MKKSFVIFGGAIAGVFVLGTGALLAADSWLDNKAETEAETELTEAIGVTADVGEADVQLLQQKVVFNDVQLANFAGFPSNKLLTINRIVIDRPTLQGQPVQMKSALIEGIQINIDGDMGAVQGAALMGSMPNLNLMQLIEQMNAPSPADGAGATSQQRVSDSNGDRQTGFTIDQLTISDVAVNINLVVPWADEPLDHQIAIPQLVLTDVTDQNFSEKIMANLGDPVIQDLQAFMFEEVLPGSLRQLTESLPAEIDLSDIELPAGMELPDNIQLPNIKLP